MRMPRGVYSIAALFVRPDDTMLVRVRLLGPCTKASPAFGRSLPSAARHARMQCARTSAIFGLAYPMCSNRGGILVTAVVACLEPHPILG